MPDGSLVTGRVAQPAADEASVAAVEAVADRVVRREPAAALLRKSKLARNAPNA